MLGKRNNELTRSRVDIQYTNGMRFIWFRSPTIQDEMCNFYLMYYVDNEDPLQQKYCFGAGPPSYYWTDPSTGLKNIPEDASRLT